MIFLSAFLLSFALNLETLRISLSYGIKKIKLTKSSTILLAIITSLGIFVSMHVGRFILYLFNPITGNIFGATLLSFTGVYLIVEHIRLERKQAKNDISCFFENSLKYKEIIENPCIVDSDKSNHIDMKECLILSHALIIYNIYTCFAAGITGISINLTFTTNFIISIIIIYLGNFNSNTYISEYFNKYSNLISGITLILLGIYENFL